MFVPSFIEIPPAITRISRHAKKILDLAITLTFDLLPGKPFKQWPLTWRMSLPSFTEICSLSTEISRHVIHVGVNGRTDGRPENIKLLAVYC